MRRSPLGDRLVGWLVADALEVLAFELSEPDAVGGVGDVEVEHGPDEREAGRQKNTRLVAAVVFAAVVAAIYISEYDPIWADLLFLLFAAGVGLTIGQWWAAALALIWPVAGAFAPTEDSGLLGRVLLDAIIAVPFTATALAVGVAALLSRRSSDDFR